MAVAPEPAGSKAVRPRIAQALARLRETATIRERCNCILDAVAQGRSRWFRLHEDKLAIAIDRVSTLTLSRFPDLKVPYHSRWRHFEALGVDRHAPLRRRLEAAADGESEKIARATIDLAVVSVLLDAGAGEQWRFTDALTGMSIGRSEGLALASLAALSLIHI